MLISPFNSIPKILSHHRYVARSILVCPKRFPSQTFPSYMVVRRNLEGAGTFLLSPPHVHFPHIMAICGQFPASKLHHSSALPQNSFGFSSNNDRCFSTHRLSQDFPWPTPCTCTGLRCSRRELPVFVQLRYFREERRYHTRYISFRKCTNFWPACCTGRSCFVAPISKSAASSVCNSWPAHNQRR